MRSSHIGLGALPQLARLIDAMIDAVIMIKIEAINNSGNTLHNSGLQR